MTAGERPERTAAPVASNGNDLDFRLVFFEEFADTRDRASCADSGDKRINAAAAIVPNLWSSRVSVQSGGRGGGKLVQIDRAGCLFRDLLCPRDGLRHQNTWRQNYFSAILARQRDLRHRIGHGQNQSVAASGSDESQTDPGVASGGSTIVIPAFRTPRGSASSISATPKGS